MRHAYAISVRVQKKQNQALTPLSIGLATFHMGDSLVWILHILICACAVHILVEFNSQHWEVLFFTSSITVYELPFLADNSRYMATLFP